MWIRNGKRAVVGKCTGIVSRGIYKHVRWKEMEEKRERASEKEEESSGGVGRRGEE